MYKTYLDGKKKSKISGSLRQKRSLGNYKVFGGNLHCISDGSSFPNMDEAMIHLVSCFKLCNVSVDIAVGLLVNTI